MNLSRRQFLGATAAAVASLTLPSAVSRLVAQSARPEAARPNVVVLLTDDQDKAGLPVMRKLTALPYGNWIEYTHAYVNEARCCPSRAALLTGQYSHHHGVVANEMGLRLDDTNTLATWLQEAGYRTGFIGKYFIDWPKTKRPPGWNVWHLRSGTVDRQVGRAIEFIEETNATQPFFLLLSFTAPHARANPGRYARTEPYMPPDPPNYNEADVSDKPYVIRRLRFRPALQAAWRRERKNAQREMMMVDDGVQTILDKLAERGTLDKTIVVFTSDNGFSWGSHRYIYKHLPYEECSGVPLFIRWPSLGRNRVESRLVSNVDLAPTIAEATGAMPRRAMDGHSLRPIITNPNAPWEEAVLLQRGMGQVYERFIGIRVPEWMYAEYENGDRELYDMRADPYQLDNLAGRPGYASIEAQLQARMRDML